MVNFPVKFDANLANSLRLDPFTQQIFPGLGVSVKG